jgi:ferritin-like metal-binding protein YciE
MIHLLIATLIHFIKTIIMEKTKKKAAPKKSAGANTGNEEHSKLQSFFKDELKDIYWAEKHLVKTLPKMQKAATEKELQNAFAEHLEQTKGHVARLEEVFSLLGEKAQAKKCDAMEGITKEGESIIEDTEKGTATRDVGLIMAAQKVEHYEIATYGGLAQLARTLGLDEIANLLTETLQEEKDTDSNLTELAESRVNEMSLQEAE